MERQIEKWDDVSKIETKSTTHLEDDLGVGKPIIIRCFEFSANPEAFKTQKPSKKELFESHKKQIEMWLWKDHLRPLEAVDTRIIVSKKKDKYRIFVGAEPAKGNVLLEQPKTLAQIAHNT